MVWKNVEKVKAYRRDYQKNIMRNSSTFKIGNSGKIGTAAEFFVAVDLLKRGLDVTKPLSTTSADDLHVRCKSGWKNIQVKTGVVNRRTGTISRASQPKKPITSDVLALVDLPGLRIRYIGNIGKLPKELA